MFAVLQEAICRGDPDLLKLILEYRDAQKNSRRSTLVPDLLRRLADVSVTDRIFLYERKIIVWF